MTDTSDITRAGRLELLRIIEDLKEENAGLRVQAKLDRVDELQASMTKLVDNSLARRVRAFHLRFGHPVAWTPGVPDEKQVRFRLKLITEEFFELLAACEIWPLTEACDMKGEAYEIRACELVKDAIENDFIDPKVIDLPEFVDALADLDYVVEGTRAVFGIDGEPIMAEVQRANMSKDPVFVATKDAWVRGDAPLGTMEPELRADKPDPTAKPTKPEGWTPPDVAGELVKQGWVKP